MPDLFNPEIVIGDFRSRWSRGVKKLWEEFWSGFSHQNVDLLNPDDRARLDIIAQQIRPPLLDQLAWFLWALRGCMSHTFSLRHGTYDARDISVLKKRIESCLHESTILSLPNRPSAPTADLTPETAERYFFDLSNALDGYMRANGGDPLRLPPNTKWPSAIIAGAATPAEQANGDGAKAADESKPDPVAMAVALLKDHPNWSARKLAKHRTVNCSHTTLTRSALFKKAKALAVSKSERPRGSKSAEGTLDAVDPASE